MVPQGLSLRPSAWAIHCTDEVLPLVPVTATTASVDDGRPYQVSPSSPSRARRPVTGSIGVSPAAAAASMAAVAGASNSTALAPSASAFSIYRRPSLDKPGQATNTSPGSISRESSFRCAVNDTRECNHATACSTVAAGDERKPLALICLAP